MFAIGQKVTFNVLGTERQGTVRGADARRRVCLVDCGKCGTLTVAFEELSPTGDKPRMLAEPDWSAVLGLCAQYVADIARAGYTCPDAERYIFEAALEACFGVGVWTWFRKAARG